MPPSVFSIQYLAFCDLLWPFSLPIAQLDVVFTDLVEKYEGNGRFYHNLSHIQYALQVAGQLKSFTQDETAIQLALWFHDVVYDPHAKDNEIQSAAYATRVLTGWGVPQKTILAVSRLILLTQKHETAESDADGQVVLDADLAILAAEPAEYGRYATAIRQEYAFVQEEAYKQGRTAVLQHFLQRSHLFFTPPMRAIEPRARQNIQEEIVQLAGI